jgi:hypothetical protein
MAAYQGGEMNNGRKLMIALGAGALTAQFGSFAQKQPAKGESIRAEKYIASDPPDWP